MTIKQLDFILIAAGSLFVGAIYLNPIAGASLPPTQTGVGSVTDDTALYQRLSEIQAKREVVPSFDSDLQRLKAVEARYRGRPMQRTLPLDQISRGQAAPVRKRNLPKVGQVEQTQGNGQIPSDF